MNLVEIQSCELDPLPTWLLKECKAELIPLIIDIVNMSLGPHISLTRLKRVRTIQRLYSD